MINQRALEKIHSYTEIGVDEGAKLLTGGEVASGNGLGDGSFYRPTIFGDVDPQMRVAQEEIFGPTTALIPVKDVDEAIRVSNGIEFGLSSSIFTRDVNTAFRAMRDLEAGITYINAGTIGAEVHLPFGGDKGTGNGHREAGQAALDVFTEWKSIYVDYSGKLQRAQIDTGRVTAPASAAEYEVDARAARQHGVRARPLRDHTSGARRCSSRRDGPFRPGNARARVSASRARGWFSARPERRRGPACWRGRKPRLGRCRS